MYCDGVAKQPKSLESGCAVSYEERPWRFEDADDAFAMSRRTRLKSRGPYRAAIPCDIAECDFRLPTAVESEASDALMEITRFDAELSSMPGEARQLPRRSGLDW
jgi:hypothetical protein